MLTLLRRRNFALLWFAGLLSLVGDRALITALPFYVYQRTGSTLASGAMFFALYLPTLLLGSVAGVFVDRWNRKRLMVVTNLLQAAIILLLLVPLPAEWLWLIYLVFFAEIALSMFFEPAENALLPHLVPESDLIAANALNELNNNLARLVGPPLGGMLLTLLGLHSVVLLDGVSFLVSALLIAGITTTPASTPDEALPASDNVLNEWRAGMRLFRQNRSVARLLIVISVISFGGTLFDPLIAPWIQSVLRGGADTLGWFSTSGAIGGIIGGALLGQLGSRIRPARFIAAGNIIGGILLLAMYNLALVPVVLVLSLLKSIPLVATGAGLQTLLQTSVPDSHRGRVYGAINTTNGVVGLLALGVAALGGEAVGITPMLSLGAGITIASGVLAWLLLPDRSVERVKG